MKTVKDRKPNRKIACPHLNDDFEWFEKEYFLIKELVKDINGEILKLIDNKLQIVKAKKEYHKNRKCIGFLSYSDYQKHEAQHNIIVNECREQERILKELKKEIKEDAMKEIRQKEEKDEIRESYEIFKEKIIILLDQKINFIREEQKEHLRRAERFIIFPHSIPMTESEKLSFYF